MRREILGYYYSTYNPDVVFCPGCAEYHKDNNDLEDEDFLPLFYYHRIDSPMHCDECDQLLLLPLTDEGIDYVIESLTGYAVYGLGRKDILKRWFEGYRTEIMERIQKDPEWFFEEIVMTFFFEAVEVE